MRLKFGMVGGAGGFIGDVHRHAAHMDDLALLTAGCFSRNMDKNRAFAEKWNITDPSRVYPDYQTMAEAETAREDGIDFVSITTPNDTHYPIAKCFLEHGIHIMCDKPLALNAEQGRELAKLAKEKDLLFGVTYTYTGYAMIRQAREMIDAGEIGRITCIQGEYPQEWLAVSLVSGSSEQATWRQDPARSGASGCCADIGTHVECLISKMTGLHPTRVIARFDSIPADIPLETNAQMMVEFDGGIPGMIWTSQVAMGHETEVGVRIFGEKGSVEWNHLRPWELRVTRINQPPQVYTTNRDYLYPAAKELCRLPSGHMEGFYEAFGNLYRGFCMNLIAKKTGGDPGSFRYPTVEDGVRGIEFVDACLKSNANNNIWVPIEHE
ncbi:Gfo/Idh/MocA family protein [Intestinibacillus sp. Marseille-P6563]|uniref:Gfo/Idh/MocA family protein n=1 Tax=Intestinibacillus sp. Marseille-P6563 TaxID=2364792 RepID=UPI000F06D699|nr:Gfo/Idh/MocA family oxidoreductase [Intestinibacillus sp. Marseille-P6563]